MNFSVIQWMIILGYTAFILSLVLYVTISGIRPEWSISAKLKKRKEKKKRIKEMMPVRKYICCVLALIAYYLVNKIGQSKEED